MISSKVVCLFVSALLMSGLAVAKPKLAIDADFADPSVIKTKDGYYAFATGGNGVNVQVAHSTDFEKWELLDSHDAVPGPYPSWIADHRSIWAPDVIQRDDGKFVMYFSARTRKDDHKHCVGAAISTNIMGPYTPEKNWLACPLDQGGAIDADGFKEGNTYYVVYKVDGNSIKSHSTPLMLQALKSDAITPVGDAVELLDRDKNDGPLIEAPSLAKIGGTYYLTFSSNYYNTLLYDVSFATASSLTGPWTKAHHPHAPLLVTGASSNVGKLGGPGGADFSCDGKKIVFHAFKNGKDIKDGRAMYIADIGTHNKYLTI